MEGIAFEGDLVEDAQGGLSRETVVVFLTRCDDESRHIEGTRGDDVLFTTLFIITVGTVLGTWEHHRQEIVIMPPGHDIHHGLGLHRRQGFIEPTEQLLITILRTAAYQQSRAGVVVDE